MTRYKVARGLTWLSAAGFFIAAMLHTSGYQSVTHRRVVAQTGGGTSVRDLGALESAVAQPRMMAGGTEAYPTLAAKPAALGFSLIRNHPFVDGKMRRWPLPVLNGFELQASVEDAERTILAIAKSEIDREALVQWVEGHLVHHRAPQ